MKIPLTLLLIFVVAVGACSSGERTSGVEEEVIRRTLFDTSMKEDVACYRIPALVTAPDGALVAAIDERVPSCADLRGSRDINIVMRRSEDGGLTWTDIETVVDHPEGESASDPSMIVDEESGEIFLFYNYMNLDEAPDVYRLHVMRSADNGRSWSGPEDITEQIVPLSRRDDFQFITSGRGIQTRSGRLLHTLVNLDSGMRLFGSDDHGETWFLLDTPIEPADESKVVELSDGRLMVNARVNRAGVRWVHVSDDEGSTWSSRPDSTLIDPGVNGSILRYSSTADGGDRDRLLFANAASPDRRENLVVRVSYDEGETWSEGKVIYPGEAAYVTMTVLEGGDIGLLYEKDDYTANEFVRFSMDYLTDGKDEGR